MTKRSIELTIPRFFCVLWRCCGINLGLCGIVQPRAANELVGAVGKDLEADHVDRNLALVEIADDPLSTFVE